jgi:hypothetical protein
MAKTRIKAKLLAPGLAANFADVVDVDRCGRPAKARSDWRTIGVSPDVGDKDR